MSKYLDAAVAIDHDILGGKQMGLKLPLTWPLHWEAGCILETATAANEEGTASVPMPFIQDNCTSNCGNALAKFIYGFIHMCDGLKSNHK